MAFGEPHHAALVADEALVDVVELLDETIDARLVEAQRLHLADDLVLELLVLALLVGRQRAALELELDVLVLEPAQPLIGIGDLVEGLEHLRLELGLDRGERHRTFEIVLVELTFRRLGAPLILAYRIGLDAERGRGGGRRRGRHRRMRLPLRRRAVSAAVARRDRRGVLGVGAGIGRFEIDDVAQEDLAVVELVAPDDDRLEGQRALAQTRDHRLAAGLDALRDRDFAFARQQLDRAHLAQIHAHRIVGALAGLGLLGLGRRRARNLDEFAVALFLLGLLACLFAGGLLALGLLGLDDVDAHLVEHRKDVLDLIGGHLLGGKHGVDLLMGDIAALLGGLDHLADGGVRKIEQRQRRIRGVGSILLRRSIVLFFLQRCLSSACHRLFSSRALPALMRLRSGPGRPDGRDRPSRAEVSPRPFKSR